MAPKSSLVSHQPSKEDDEYDDASSSEEEAVAESDSNDSDSEDSSSNYLLKPVTKASAVSSLKSSGDEEILQDSSSSKKKKADGGRIRDDEILHDSSSSKKKKADGGRSGDDEILLQDCSSSKKKKADGGRSGPGLISRVWSDEDEIVVLKEMAKLKASNPKAADVHSFIKGKLKVDFSKEQLRSKITRFKKRFSNALKKGSDPVFSKPHEKLVFKLSNKIWGNSVNNNALKKETTHEINNIVENGGGDFWSKYPNIDASLDNINKVNYPSLSVGGVSSLKEKLSGIGNVKAKKLDDKWKQLAVEQLQLNHKMLVLIKDQLQMVFDK